MPGFVGFQLALDVTKLIPVALNAGSQLLALARDFRKSGSDLVVEADLAEIFGGAKILPQFEMSFREVVKVRQYIPLSHGCEIELQSGPGPTLSNALRDQRYLA